MACDHKKEISPEPEWTEALRAAPKSKNHHGGRDKSRKEQRVRNSPVSLEVAVSNSKPESNDVQIRKNGASRADCPNTLWNTRPVETRSDAQGCHRV